MFLHSLSTPCCAERNKRERGGGVNGGIDGGIEGWRERGEEGYEGPCEER